MTRPPVEVVFVMDTSGSMSGEAAALCNAISMVEGELMALGIEATSHLLGITAAPGGSFGCLTNSVLGLLGGVVPGNGACGPLRQGRPPNRWTGQDRLSSRTKASALRRPSDRHHPFSERFRNPLRCGAGL